ncbi:MAG TPA: hypothetical protein VGI60_02705 [Chthoniobacterales bacterium]|jgi:hypothetical protein
MGANTTTASVALDAHAREHVEWYASVFQRDFNDIVNGIVAGELEAIRENFDVKTWTCNDDIASIAEENIIDAIKRRREAEVERQPA